MAKKLNPEILGLKCLLLLKIHIHKSNDRETLYETRKYFECAVTDFCTLGSSKKFKRLSVASQTVLPGSGGERGRPVHQEMYTPLAVVSRARKTLRVSTTATDTCSANSGCFIERARCDRHCTRHCTQHAKIPSGSSMTSGTWIIVE
jgi:hypothetical protein